MQPARAIYDFWCDRCKKDWTLECHQTERWFIAWCPKCRNELRRWRGGDVRGDPYWRLSQKVRRQLQKHWKDILQPGDPDFDKYYPQYKKEREEKLAEEEKNKQSQ